jgi:hypothetical protein
MFVVIVVVGTLNIRSDTYHGLHEMSFDPFIV